ncbi:hypothetical protein [Photobacterium sp. 53610]|uniref:hypothetical protein n=1 Tax=Photobacterium sp. 53610 TaxID=3102789 RepID=UPI002EDAEF1F
MRFYISFTQLNALHRIGFCKYCLFAFTGSDGLSVTHLKRELFFFENKRMPDVCVAIPAVQYDIRMNFQWFKNPFKHYISRVLPERYFK